MRRVQNDMWSHLQAPLQEVHQRWEQHIRLSLAHFKHPERVLPLGCQVQRQQHRAVHAAALRIRHSQVDALVVGLHVVAELRLHAHDAPRSSSDAAAHDRMSPSA
jgi:hypothetical protein